MTEEIEKVDVSELLGDISEYTPREVENVEFKEPIGKFDATVIEALTKTGVSQKTGKPWGLVNIVVELADETVLPRIVRATYFIGKEKPKFPPNYDGTQTMLFLDHVKDAGMTFDQSDFSKSLIDLTGQKCRVRVWARRTLNPATGKKEVMLNDSGYKNYDAALIKAEDTLPSNAPF